MTPIPQNFWRDFFRARSFPHISNPIVANSCAASYNHPLAKTPEKISYNAMGSPISAGGNPPVPALPRPLQPAPAKRGGNALALPPGAFLPLPGPCQRWIGTGLASRVSTISRGPPLRAGHGHGARADRALPGPAAGLVQQELATLPSTLAAPLTGLALALMAVQADLLDLGTSRVDTAIAAGRWSQDHQGGRASPSGRQPARN